LDLGCRLSEVGRERGSAATATGFVDRPSRSLGRTRSRRLPGQTVLERDGACGSADPDDAAQAYSGWNNPPRKRICSRMTRDQRPGPLDRAGLAL